MSKIILAEQASAPDTPGSGKVAIYVDSNGDLAWKDDAGNINKIASAGAYTLTIAASGTTAVLGTAQTFSARQTFTGGINAQNGIRTVQITVADDVVVDLVATYGAPVEGLICYQVGTAQGYAAIASFRAAATPYCQLLVQYGSTTSVGTTELTDGTSDGTDGNVNIAATSDGKLIVKNRTGGSKRLTILVIG